MFGIKRRFQLCKVLPPRFKESSLRAHQIWVPLENVRFLLLSTNLAREWLPIDRHRLAAYHNNHCWRAFPGYQHRWPWTTLNPKNRGFSESEFFSDFRLQYTFSEWIAPKPFKIDQHNMHNMHMKCSALNVDFNCVRFYLLGSRSPPYERIKFGYPLENVRFCYCRLI